MKFNVLYADPPWKYKDKRNHSSMGMAESSYPTMELEDIKNLPVQEIISKDALLFMWATWPKMPEALEVIDAWGFTYTTCAFVWVKLNPTVTNTKVIYPTVDIYSGLGHWVNGNTEYCLLSRKGKAVTRQDFSIKQVVFWPRGAHSVKPEEARVRIDKLVGNKVNKLELFGRELHENWTVLGNEISGKTIQEDLDEIVGRVS
jgi:site-specific DNA-methyltransferase (adenine-specific)